MVNKIKELICKVFGHTPNKDRIWKFGNVRYTYCKRCGKQITKELKVAEWK